MAYFTWDPANAFVGSSLLVFSNSNRTVTKTGGGGNTFRSGRSIETIAAGVDGTATVTVANISSPANTIIGLCKSTQTFGSGDYIGVNTNGAGFGANGSAYFAGSATGSAAGTWTNGDTLTLRYTRSGANTLIALSVNGGAFSSDTTVSNLNGATVYLAYTTFVDTDAFTTEAVPAVTATGSTTMMMGV